MVQSTTQKEGVLACLNVIKEKEVDVETLTVLCFKAFPSLYSMDLYKQYPRMDKVTRIVREHVENGFIKEENGKYKISEKGLEWGEHNTEIVRRAANIISPDKENFYAYQLSNEEYLKETKKLQKTDAYKKFLNNKKEPINIGDFMDFLKIDIYATKQLFDRKVKRVAAICESDPELKSLFDFMSNKFGNEYTNFKLEIEKLMRENNDQP